MNKTLPLLIPIMNAWMAPAQALETVAYSPQALPAKQQAGEVVGLHFHAKLASMATMCACWVLRC